MEQGWQLAGTASIRAEGGKRMCRVSHASRMPRNSQFRSFGRALALAFMVFALILSALPRTAFAADGGSSSSPASSSSDGGSSAASSGELKTVRIGFPSAGNNWYSGALGVAAYEGYLDEYLKPLGYKAEATGFVGAAPALHEALSAGDLDYVDYAGFAGILGKSKGIDLTILAVTDYGSQWRLVARTDRGIKSVKDLKGKKVAYQRGATPQMYLVKALQEAGLSFGDVEAINATIPDGLSTLASGGIDAAVVSAGQEQKLVDAGTAVVIHEGVKADAQTFYEPVVLAGRTQFVKDNPKINVAILKALIKAKNKIAQDPEAFYELSAQQSGSPLNVIKASAVEDQDTARPFRLDKDLMESLDAIQDFEVDNKIITQKTDIASWTDPTYLEQAYEEYGTDGKGTDGTKLAAAAVKGTDAAKGAASKQVEQPVLQRLAVQLPVAAAFLVVAAAIVLARRRVHAAATAGVAPTPAQRAVDVLYMLIAPAAVFVLWHVVTAAKLLPTMILPTISTVVKQLGYQLTDGTFKGDLAISISRILKGYALAAVAGVFFGVIMGMSLSANKFFILLFKAIRQIPMMAWVPLLVIWFGIGEESKVAVIVLASFFPILVNTIDGIQRTDPKLVEVGKMYRLSRWRMFREIYLPSALPSIFVGLKLALGISWMAVVGAEMIAASSGIGFRINDARVLMDYPTVFAGMIAIAVAGVLMDAVLSVIARAVTPWQNVKQGR